MFSRRWDGVSVGAGAGSAHRSEVGMLSRRWGAGVGVGAGAGSAHSSEVMLLSRSWGGVGVGTGAGVAHSSGLPGSTKIKVLVDPRIR